MIHTMDISQKQIAVFGGGCFWCTEAVFAKLKGVLRVLPGYAGGTIEDPTYEQVSMGDTGHAEVIQIEFNPQLITYRDLLTVFFATHDPTTLDRQGNDIGTQYRSVIFFTDDSQKMEALEKIHELETASTMGGNIVTEVVPLPTTGPGRFFMAEDYHHQYAARNPGNRYCQLIINPKLEKVQKDFADLLENGSIQKMSHSDKIQKTEEEWKKELSPEEYAVLRNKATERPFSGELPELTEKDGVFACKACGNPLFSADAKFDSGTGWPSFDQAIPGAIEEIHDTSHGMNRTEVVCSRCGSHLGHLFNDGPTKTGMRYCINSVCLGLENNN